MAFVYQPPFPPTTSSTNTGGAQPFAPKQLNPSLLAVQVDNPPPRMAMCGVMMLALVVQSWVPPPPVPQQKTKLNPSLLAVQVNTPSRQLDVINRAWQAQPALLPVRQYVVQAASALVNDPPYSYSRQLDVINRAWQAQPALLPVRQYVVQAASALVNDPPYSYSRQLDVINRAWQAQPALLPVRQYVVQAASALVNDPPYSYSRQLDVINRAWQAQPALLPVRQYVVQAASALVNDPPYSYSRQLDVINRAWQTNPFAQQPRRFVLQAVHSLISADIQQANVGALWEGFELDLNPIGVVEKLYFHNGINALGNDVVWQGLTYSRFPIEATGFERNGTGTQPRPTIRVANINGLIGALSRANQDLVQVKLTRRRTFVKYLDAVNFAGGINYTADANVHFDDEIWFIDRKASENKIIVEWELVSAFDVQGVQLPRRQCIQNVCVWKYRGAECGFAGGAVADKNDIAVTDINLDACGKRLSSCRLRFANAELPFGGFPSVGLIK